VSNINVNGSVVFSIDELVPGGQVRHIFIWFITLSEVTIYKTYYATVRCIVKNFYMRFWFSCTHSCGLNIIYHNDAF
jgi:hypothetical protein